MPTHTDRLANYDECERCEFRVAAILNGAKEGALWQALDHSSGGTCLALSLPVPNSAATTMYWPWIHSQWVGWLAGSTFVCTSTHP